MSLPAHHPILQQAKGGDKLDVEALKQLQSDVRSLPACN
jgi:hypothetical protein